MKSVVSYTGADPSPAPLLQPTTAAKTGDAGLDIVTLAAKALTEPATTAKEGVFSVVRLIRAARAGQFSEQLREEMNAWTAQGKIRSDYIGSSQAQTIFADTMESLEDANFDDEQLDVLRRLFLAAASESLTNREDLLVRQYMEIGRGLSAGEIRILAAYYRYLAEWPEAAPRHVSLHNYGVNESLAVMRRYSGLTYTALMEKHERSLIEKGLVRPLGPVGGAAQVDRETYRLTDFGKAFCDFLAIYDNLKGT